MQGPCHCGAEHQHRLEEPGRAPPLPSALTQPWERSRCGEQEGDMYILSDDCESEPEAGLVAPAPAAPRGDGGCRASAGRSGKPKLGLLKGTYRKTMRQIRCCLYKGINTEELDASLCFGAQSKSWGQGPPAVPWHRDTNTAQSPQHQGQGQGTRRLPVTTGRGGSTDCPRGAAAAPPRASPHPSCLPGQNHPRGPAQGQGCGRQAVRGGAAAAVQG